MQRKIIYALKSAVQKNTALYSFLYQSVTLNFDYLQFKLQRQKFPSRFGGLWTDGDQFDSKLEYRLRSGSIDDVAAQKIQQFRRNGVLLLENAVPDELIDRYLNELNALCVQKNTPLLVTSMDLDEPVRYTSDAHTHYRSIRTVDDYFFLSSAREILFYPRITQYLELLLERPLLLTQSLSFLYGSQQGMHRDTSFVRMNSPMKLLGVWIALEDVSAGSGELIYFPGSHHWEDYMFSGRFKHYDRERDGEQVLDDNHLWLYRQAEQRDIEEEHFLAKRGDVLIWHADLAHGGAHIANRSATRKSLVGHFCPRNVKPLYAYYKPKQRKIYRDSEKYYMSSYYRV